MKRAYKFLPWLLSLGAILVLAFWPQEAQAAQGCSLGDFNPAVCFTSFIVDAILTLAANILAISGLILDLSVDYLVVEMSQRVRELQQIDILWVTIRDLVNILFIFGILYIAIGTILDINKVDWKKGLRNIVIAALLVNFSLFATKAIIDASNILALQFYEAIEVESVEDDFVADGKISNVFISSLKLSTVYPNLSEDATLNDTGGTGDDVANDIATIANTPNKLLLIGSAGTVFFLTAAFVFLAIAILLVVRFVVLVLVMILSPLAVAGAIFPQMKQKVTDKWLDQLIKQSFFAPAMFLMIYIVASIVSSQGFQAAFDTQGQGFFESLGESTINIVLNFSIIIGLLIAALMVAVKIGAVGGQKAVSIGSTLRKKTTSAIGRNTLGRAGRRAAQYVDEMEASGSATARMVGKTLRYTGAREGAEKVASATYGGDKGMNLAKQEQRGAQARDRVEKKRQEVKLKRAVDESNESEVRSVMSKMSTGQKLSLGVGTLSDPLVAKHLTDNEISSVEKKKEWTEAQKQEVIQARIAGLTEDVRQGLKELKGGEAGAEDTIKENIGSLSEDTVVNMFTNYEQLADINDEFTEKDFIENLMTVEVVDNLSQEQFNKLMESKDVDQDKKDRLKELRMERMLASRNADDIREYLGEKTAEDIASRIALDAQKIYDDQYEGSNTEVIKYLTPRIHQEIGDKVKRLKDRRGIKKAVRDNPDTTEELLESVDYFRTPAGQV